MHLDITIVTVCVDFSDYLARVIESWKRLGCRRILVITTHDDINTHKFCLDNDLHIKSMERTKWIRGKYLNVGLLDISTEWTLILDSDTWVPDLTIDTNKLDPRCLYGLPFVPMTPESLEDFKYDNKLRSKPRLKSIGMGFFQLFSTIERNNRSTKYLEHRNVMKNGKGTDFKFAKNWKIERLSNDYVLCISNGTNRHGRKTGELPPITKSKKSILNDKLRRFRKFANAEIGITIYEK